MASTLSAHSPKFNSFLTTRDGLAALPEPVSLGRMHRPIHHARLVDALTAEVDRRGFNILRESFALGKKETAIFGVMDLEPKDGVTPEMIGRASVAMSPDRTLSLGFRSGNDRSMAIKLVAGTRVFVCDNLALMGDVIAMKRMHTTGLDLADALGSGFDKFVAQTEILDAHIERLADSKISDDAARSIGFAVFAQGIVPSRLLDDVNRFYFKPTDDMTDCTPRSLWGLHNAFTRAMHDLTPVRQMSATVALGKYFGMAVEDKRLLTF
jgi:hypothetical protein